MCDMSLRTIIAPHRNNHLHKQTNKQTYCHIAFGFRFVVVTITNATAATLQKPAH